jgi:hypothetical protein
MRRVEKFKKSINEVGGTFVRRGAKYQKTISKTPH